MRVTAVAILVAQCAWPVHAWAASSSATLSVAQAKAFYHALDFEKCLKRLKRANADTLTAEELSEVELFTGLCQSGLSDNPQIRFHFQRALKLNPGVTLPAGTSPKVINLFEAERRALGMSSAKVVEVEKSRPPEPILEEPSAVAAPTLVPREFPAAPGYLPEVHQTPAGNKLVPGIFAGVTVAAVATAVVFGMQAQSAEREARDAHFDTDRVRLNEQANTRAQTANLFFIGAAVTGAAALVTGWVLN